MSETAFCGVEFFSMHDSCGLYDLSLQRYLIQERLSLIYRGLWLLWK